VHVVTTCIASGIALRVHIVTTCIALTISIDSNRRPQVADEGTVSGYGG
jgi:hypothetical protein